jgi:hypothetical protein
MLHVYRDDITTSVILSDTLMSAETCSLINWFYGYFQNISYRFAPFPSPSTVLTQALQQTLITYKYITHINIAILHTWLCYNRQSLYISPLGCNPRFFNLPVTCLLIICKQPPWSRNNQRQTRPYPEVTSVRYHCGGWPEEVNTCFLNSYMVYF